MFGEPLSALFAFVYVHPYPEGEPASLAYTEGDKIHLPTPLTLSV